MPPRAPLRFATAFAVYTAQPGDILGRGGNGTVYRATDEAGQPFAVKVLDPTKVTKEKAKRFKNEILFGMVDHHPAVVRVLDFGSVALDGKAGREASFYVMPLYASTLRGRIAQGIAPAEVLPLFATLLDGVEAAHLKGVVHRDLKPENVFCDAKSNRLVVGDFGVARFSDEELYTAVETRASTRLANFQYAAPEQKMRGRPVDLRADLYALGLMLNELFTGEIPHGTGFRTVSAAAAEFAFVDDIVAEMIRQAPQDRPASIDAVKVRLLEARQAFVARQKLDALKQTVVPRASIADPLLDDPIRIVRAEAQGPDVVLLHLNRAPTAKWMEALRDVGNYSYTLGYDPKHMFGERPTVQIRGQEHVMQSVIDSLKAMIERANSALPHLLRREASEREAEEQRQLRARVEAEEKRIALQQRLRI